MKSWDVFLDSFVNVLLPDDLEPGSEEWLDALWNTAIAKYRQKLSEPGEVTFTWRRYPENDTQENSK